MPIKNSLLAAALLLPLAVLAQTAPLLSITDPDGDDVGDGTLQYPRDSAFQSGDLDLRQLQVFAADGGLRFEATFRNPIRSPADVKAPGLGGEPVSTFARRGFYAFNLDIYLDTDRLPGSGNTVMLPGRRGAVDPAHAWERAVVLTPRPELMRRQLNDALADAAPAGGADVAATVDRSVFFATDVRVRGRTVSFFVPAGFVDAQALSSASLTAVVTEAKLAIEADSGGLLGKSSASAVERLVLGAAQPEPGLPELAMGYASDRAPATAIVDLLSPDPRQQPAQLAAGARVTGLNRDNRFGAVSVVAAPTPVAAAPAATAPAGGSWFSRALDGLARMFGGGSPAPAPAVSSTSAPGSAPNLQSLMTPAGAPAPATAAAAPQAPQPAAVVAAPAAAPVPVARPAQAATPAANPAAAPRARDAASADEIEQRLITLKRLRDRGLISEDEYQQKRREILALL